MQNLIIYKASAGSGKTYKLTEEYLRLAFKKPFHQVLAVTFTNKATSEMKERITGELFRLHAGSPSGYLDVIMDDTGFDEATVREKAGLILNDILQNYSRFSVGTIDSFFQRIIRSFARETGLQSGFELELDNGRILDRVIDRLIVETDTNNELLDWLMKFAESRIDDGQSWNFRQDVGRLGYQVFSETFLQFRREMTQKLSDKAFMEGYSSSLRAIAAGFEKKMEALGKEALDLIAANGLTVSDFFHGAKGVAGYFINISSNKKYEPGIRALDAENDPAAWVTKSSGMRQQIIGFASGRPGSILREALQLYRTDYRLYTGCRLVLSNFYTLGIMNDITRHIREYAEENNVFLLSDVANLLARVIGENDAPFIYEKTGCFFRHFMIDEFQDTSGIQWKNFVPLIKDSLSEGNRNIIVGDVKQSIYRWRSGDWRILAGGIEEEMKIHSPLIRSLAVNWRSQKVIVDFNNYLFSKAPLVMGTQFENECLNAGYDEELTGELHGQITSAYKEQFQETPSGKSGDMGHITVRFYADQEAGWRDEALKNLPGLLLDVVSRGYSLLDIAILVRNKRDGNQVACSLLEWQTDAGKDNDVRLDFISEEFLHLNESSSVSLLLSLMSYLANPGEKINRAMIINEYCRYLERPGSDPAVTDHELFGHLSDGEAGWPYFLPEGFIGSRERLSGLSLYEMVEELILMFDLVDRENEIPYLLAFQDAVLDFSSGEAGGAGHFIEWWEENCGNISVSSSDRQDAMKIMTIHKAKGLQFKVVVIPFADWNCDHNPLHDNFMWCMPPVSPFNKLEVVPVKYRSDMAKSIFADDYFNEKMQVFVDNLNLLYVGFTRAEDELYVSSPLLADQGGNKPVKTVGGLLYQILAAETGSDPVYAGSWNEGETTFSAGKKKTVGSAAISVLENEIRIGHYQVNRWKDKLRLRLYGNVYFARDRGIGKRIDRGRLMHEIFEKIISAEDVGKAVLQKYHEGKITMKETGELTGGITRIIGHEKVSHWFDGSWKVRNESGILLKNGKTRRPDRVMEKEGEMVVLDYKFGMLEQESYTRQVMQYMKELQVMGYKRIKGFVWYVPAGIINEVECSTMADI
jgi:ATP-dependent helicase/nuclease subunit A